MPEPLIGGVPHPPGADDAAQIWQDLQSDGEHRVGLEIAREVAHRRNAGCFDAEISAEPFLHPGRCDRIARGVGFVKDVGRLEPRPVEGRISWCGHRGEDDCVPALAESPHHVIAVNIVSGCAWPGCA